MNLPFAQNFAEVNNNFVTITTNFDDQFKKSGFPENNAHSCQTKHDIQHINRYYHEDREQRYKIVRVLFARICILVIRLR